MAVVNGLSAFATGKERYGPDIIETGSGRLCRVEIMAYSMFLDFDKLKDLAESSPEDFERERLALINEALQQFRNDSRAQAAQWRIDRERIKAKTPLGACIRLSSLMWDEFFKLEESLHHLADEATSHKGRPAGNVTLPKRATVLPFKKPSPENPLP